MINGVEGCRNIKEAETRDLLMRDGRNKFVVERREKGFSGVSLGKTRLMWVKE